MIPYGDSSCGMLRRGMTLVEMLIATTMSLIIMGVVAQLFSVLGRSVSGSQSTTTMNEQLRGVAQMLRRDLNGITVTTLPPVRPDRDSGYLEIIEGPATDTTNAAPALDADCDDILMFTTKSLGKPFVGVFNGNSSIESQFAEVAWFCKQSADQPVAGTTLYTLYRRQLLSMAYVGAGDFLTGSNSVASPGNWGQFYVNYDLSCRLESGRLYPNSLGDLTKRENRFLHKPVFPFFFDGTLPGLVLSGTGREGNDVILTNVIAFDVRVFDPSAPTTTGASSTGAYVNLNWNSESTPATVGSTFPASGNSAFKGWGVSYKNNSPSTSPSTMLAPTYDTWSLHYEFNGIDEDGIDGADQGTNGKDDNGNDIVDDAAEAETSAPYPVPLRGLEVRIRCYEPSSRQVRQITVRQTFVPH
jgi:prepilin-type N-terminal cleavage/methylation domain-containing protein